ncbi:hypothetical protein WG66_013659 [Moniliophthora roreri]|nr:hypothetical protein WG66_013659 [Moniliophthora roreri]
MSEVERVIMESCTFPRKGFSLSLDPKVNHCIGPRGKLYPIALLGSLPDQTASIIVQPESILDSVWHKSTWPSPEDNECE